MFTQPVSPPKAQLKLKIWWQISAYALLAAVLVASLMPTEFIPQGNDKIQHLLTYSVLSVWYFLVFQARIPKSRARIAVGLIVFGGIIELLQGLTSYRYAEWADVLANSCGVLIATLLLPQKVHEMFVAVDKILGR